MDQDPQGIGHSSNRYMTIPRTLCFITHGNEVLLLRGAPDKPIWPNQYNGIGGHVERGEDIYTAAQREIQEETGLAISDLQLCGIANIASRPQGPGVMLFIFAAQAAGREIQPSAEGIPVWVPQDQLLELDLVHDLPLILPRVLAIQPHDPPFFAHYTMNETGQLIVTFADH